MGIGECYRGGAMGVLAMGHGHWRGGGSDNCRI